MWEYHTAVLEVSKLGQDADGVTKYLNSFGKKNWELVSFTKQSEGSWVAVFKRLKGIDGPTG